MKSTGEVMGIDDTFGKAYYKAMLAAGNPLPLKGNIYVTVRSEDRALILPVASKLAGLGLKIHATRGTAGFLRDNGVEAETTYRISEKTSPDALGLMRRGEIYLIINTPTETSGARRDGFMMRRLAVDMGIPFITTIQAARAAVEAMASARNEELGVTPLHEFAKRTRLRSGTSIEANEKCRI